MPLPQPNLDDRTFDDLVAEARAMIPRLAPGWTNYNPSDPGITLIELFAWLTEMMLYRLNRVPDEHYEVFLELIGKPWNKEEDKTIELAIARGLRFLQKRSRAVSLDDFEQLALESTKSPDGVAKIARAKALSNINLENNAALEEGHISVVILPRPTAIDLPAEANLEEIRKTMMADPLDEIHSVNKLRKAVTDYLEPKRLLTTVVHVVAPGFVDIKLDITVAGRPGVDSETLQKDVKKRLCDFVNPYEGGGEDGKGWPFGQALRRFEIYQQIEALNRVDYVESLVLNGNPVDNEVPIKDYELPCLSGDAVNVTVKLT